MRTHLLTRKKNTGARSVSAMAFVLSVASLSAQIPNAGFENWTDLGGYIEPTGWLTYNDVITTGGPLTSVEQGTPGFPGNYHCVITTRAVPSGSPIQGWLSAGSDHGQAGFAYAQRPTVLTGQWQYGIQAGDTAQVLVALSRWNSSTGNTEMVASGSLEVSGNLGAWQAFSVPITYFTNEIPDTAYIQIVSSIDFDAPIVGSFVKVDDLAFGGVVGIPEQELPEVSVYPSPASSSLHISTTSPGELSLMDSSGRVLLRSTTEGAMTVDVSSFASGLYSYQFIAKQGGATVLGRWVKE